MQDSTPDLIPTLDGDQLDRLASSPNALLEFLTLAAGRAVEGGVGLCRYFVQGQPYILIADPALAYLYKTKFYDNTYRTIPYWETYAGNALVGSTDPNVTKIFRDHYSHALRDSKRLNTETAAIIGAHMKTFLGRGDGFLISNSADYFRTLALELAVRIFAGFDADDFERMQKPEVVAATNQLLWGPPDSLNGLHLLGLKPGPKQRNNQTELTDVAEFRQRMMKAIQELIFDPFAVKIQASDNLLHQLWKSNQQSKDDSGLTLENFYPEAFFFFAGGLVITVADSLPSIAKLICSHPDVLARLQAELDAKAIDGQLSDMVDLPYLNMCIKEALRLEPPVPVTPARMVEQEFELNGIKIKRGDCVVLSQAVMHKLPHLWNRPTEYNPERFSPENAANIPQGAYFPHGMGARSCIGRHHGDRVLRNFLAELFYRFDVRFEATRESHLNGPTMVTETRIMLTPRQTGLQVQEQAQVSAEAGKERLAFRHC